MTKAASGGIAAWGWPVLSCALAAMVMYLAYQNIQLKKDLADTTHPAGATSQVVTAGVGEPAPPFEVYLSDWSEMRLSTDSLDAPLVLGWFSFDCEPCVDAIDSWNRVSDMYPGQFLAVTRDQRELSNTIFAGTSFSFPVLVPLSDTVFSLYKISATPQTMLIGTDGRISHIWLGPLSGEAIDSIKHVMGVPYAERR